MKNRFTLIFYFMIALTQTSYAKVDSNSAKVDIKVTKVECLNEVSKLKGYVAIAQVKKAPEGSPSSEIKIFFDTKKKDAVSFLEGDEATITLHKEGLYWVVKSPEDKKGTVFSAGMLPTCH